jgi:IS605 OrfB family transposase
MHGVWKKRWEMDDGKPAQVDKPTGTKSAEGSGLHSELRWLTDWIMGKYLSGATNQGWKQNVGGLSITRIATMKSLYQLHKAFAMRARPDKPRGAPEKGDTNAGIAQSILDAMEQMREQRVKQLASRIAEAALGIGRIKSEYVAAGAERPRKRVDDPCHAVVIENLTNYRPDELQTRRENRQLMAWSSSKVRKYLSEACQLHGLHLREVQAGYTSRQDSRTGAPGVRCADVTVHEFMTASWWRKQVNTAKKKKDEKNGGSARDRYLLDLDGNCAKIPQEKLNPERSIRIPMNGGDLFVSATPCACDCCKREDRKGPPGLQADLNAAANIGLKALLDPDWSGKWWYIPCESVTYTPHAEKTKGSVVISTNVPLVYTTANAPLPNDPENKREEATPKKTGKKNREIVNLWRDPTHSPINGNGQSWRSSKEYWNGVQLRVIEVLRVTTDRVALVKRDFAPANVPW